MTRKEKPTDYSKISFVIILAYISFINFFVLKTTPEIILLQFALLVFIYRKLRLRVFFKQWIPFVGFFILYEFLRGIVDDVSPFYDTTFYWVYEFEDRVFGKLPTLYLQDALRNHRNILDVSFFFYTLFFYYSFLVGFIVWLKRPQLFGEYSKKFLIMSYIGLIFFFLIPTAPPWLVDKLKDIGVERYLYRETALNTFNFVALTLYRYFVYGNAVAALPSLHAAWPAFTSLFLVKTFKNKALYLLFIIPVMVGFSVVLNGEHYAIDVLFGWILAAGAVFISKRSFDKLKTTLKSTAKKIL